MAKITPVTNGLQGLTTRTQLNEAMKTVEVSSKFSGDGSEGSTLDIDNIPWGTLNGTLSNQTDLQTALDAKQIAYQKQVVVNSMSDFPAPVTGVITLVADTRYLIANDLTTSDRFVLPNNCTLKGLSTNVSTMTYTGTGDMFTWVNSGIILEDFIIVAALGRVINASNTGQVLRFENIVILECDRIGIFAGSSSPRFTFFTCVDAKTDGIEFSGTFANVLYGPSLMVLNGGTMFKLGSSTFDSFTVNPIDITLGVGTTFISGLANSGNINVGGTGQVLTSRFSGAGTILADINIDDIRWVFDNNDDISDTNPDSLIAITDNATETVIANPSTDGTNAVLVTGTWDLIRESQYSSTAAGRVTALAPRPMAQPVDIQVTAAAVSGTNKVVAIYLAVDGVVIPAARSVNKVGQNDPRTFSIPWQINFTTGKFIEVFVENQSDAVNIIVTDAIIRVR